MSLAPNSAEFQLSPSFYYLSARLVLAALAAALIILLPILIWVKLIGLLCVGLAVWYLAVDYRSQRPEKLILLDAKEDRWCLKSAAETVELVLAPTQFVTRHLVILYFKLPEGGQIVRVVPRDSLTAAQHRLLRMVLIGRAFK